MPKTPLPISPRLRAILGLVALIAIALPALIVATAAPITPRPRIAAVPQRVVPQAELPPVEPLAYQDLDPDEARAFNKTVPFSTDPNPPARPFFLTGTVEDKARATDCMAVAMLYEAGDDTLGQRSVGQVVINRVRHPAFPKTICGVVFQGSERSTGCQFTFTCDGVLMRHAWSDEAWRRARETAALALTGRVFKAVGYSTHYHTDWVVPYWQSSLDKVARVRTHLFFRWTGWWGTPPAFRRAVSPSEPVIPALAALSDAHKTGAALAEAEAAKIEAAAAEGTLPAPAPGDADSFLVTIDPKLAPESYATLAAATCADRPYCKFMGWSSKARTPTALPLQPAQVAAMSFSYLRDHARGYDKPLWNCAEFPRPDKTQCMKLQMLPPAVPVTRPAAEVFKLETLPGSKVSVPVAKPAPDALTGVRRRVEMTGVPPKPVATPTATAEGR
ncbi:SleB-like protein [Sphingomonas sp. Leaf357]|uniref:cell wall hydrolase n=1 Tax=Sphingomonas sp. Leaf357 TaxID=1736350 RepID=UPI0006FA0448|nr:cell wall hydrolase [Sphingomonas sp. Leaf357]KQS04774.1 SleB-like protein [Sphingomonas sp. Leaf357]